MSWLQWALSVKPSKETFDLLANVAIMAFLGLVFWGVGKL